MILPATDADTVRQYVAQRTSGRVPAAPAFRRRVGSPPFTLAWFAPILTPYLLFVHTHRGLAAKTARKYTRKLGPAGTSADRHFRHGPEAPKRIVEYSRGVPSSRSNSSAVTLGGF